LVGSRGVLVLLSLILASSVVGAAFQVLTYLELRGCQGGLCPLPTAPTNYQGAPGTPSPNSAATNMTSVVSNNSRAGIANGFYAWEPSLGDFAMIPWQGGPFMPLRDGYSIIYFHNNQCPWCQRLYPALHSYLRANGSGIDLYMVASEWFENTDNPYVAETFRFYRVDYYPQLLLVYKNGSSVQVVAELVRAYVERYNRDYTQDVAGLFSIAYELSHRV